MRNGRRTIAARRVMAAGALAVVGLAVSPPTGAGQAAGPARTSHVILISVDGLRPDAIERFGLTTLQALADAGAHTLEATTVLPSLTLPSHAAMLTGVGPEVHGITWNRYRPAKGVVQVPTIFELARADGHHVAAFYAKAKLRHLDRPDSYDHRVAPRWRSDNWMATDIVQAAVQYLAHQRPNLLFVHVAEPDYAGHLTGWMGRAYAFAARRADAAVAELVAAARAAFGPQGFTVIVTADHGGHDRAHGTTDPRDVLIPWIVHGEGVIPGPLPARIRTMDTAATVLWLLGVARPASFEGRAIEEAFGEAGEPITSARGSP